ncbi:MAG TPA: TraI domain-containing protein, partial [Burkholderiaceae bacterium]|nr:TraI domain-containing protein [Burkholderiaceae bacterium]
MSAALLLLALACVALAAACLGWAIWPTRSGLRYSKAERHSKSDTGVTTTPAAPVAVCTRDLLRARRPNWLKVLRADDLLQLMDASVALEHMYRASRLTRSAWERDLLPGLKRYAEFVQMMPASEAHHHAHVGGLLAHTLEMVLAALRWRIGRLLPQGACAETLDARRDHWTYAVFYGALLHDIGKVMADLRVEWAQAGRSEALRWSAVTGSLVDVGADEYHVSFTPRAERNYVEHARQGILLLQS